MLIFLLKDALYTILDKTVEKIAYLGAFFLNFVADRFFPPPLPLEAVLLGLQKKAGSLSICRKQVVRGDTLGSTNQKAGFRSRGTNGAISVQNEIM